MKKLLFLLLWLFVATLIGLNFSKDSGYVAIYYQHWKIETTLLVAIIACVVCFTIAYVLVRCSVALVRLPKKIKKRKTQRSITSAQRLTRRGLCYLAEGVWHKAERCLIKAAQSTQHNLVNYLAAARAAQALQAYDRRNDYLRLASCQNKQGNCRFAVGLTQAQLQIDAQQWEQALATLQHLYQAKPDHRYTLQLLQKVYLHAGAWSELKKLLPQLEKLKVLRPKALYALTEQVYLALLNKHAEQGLQSLTVYWENLPDVWQNQLCFLKKYIDHLLKFQQDKQVQKIITKVLRKNWDGELALVYCRLKTSDVAEQITLMEKYLQKHANDAQLLHGLGILYMQEQLWARAIKYLLKSIALMPSPVVYHRLGMLYEQQQQSSHALKYYQQGLQILQNNEYNEKIKS